MEYNLQKNKKLELWLSALKVLLTPTNHNFS